ncbi:glycine cleavage T-C-terminal barrel domain protein [Ehrlichia chaffeensis str. Heartland]|nr:glycine cleavage T-C-terminal barrel domain protein [Ehrlichia chaffeensis str. Heartland]AHX05999.1 glycine cleavage T-C-terminal barrel domain protein [Ehrlichia chaffeensis str. Jax]AHX06989.1 glycine cleavage T-C-terminal barrel domain protein [Ehrlichia chaffeensis str. Liberty]AHX09024.1 glycine cleavage T-C-terminal barrel domain protein [Ehrlichia chaffeensis str. Saint Vincent]AHX09822.1 glycine cleavage T-C-terminal barrel domain protein [Ehrlichia chaffeensis str. Wakulla]AHX1069
MPDRSIIVFYGQDVKQLLNQTTTNNVLNLSQNKAIYSLLLSPSGRYIYDFFIVQYGKYVLLDCCSTEKEEIIQKFLSYKLQLKIVIKEKKHYKVGVFIGDQYDRNECGYTYCQGDTIFFQDPRLSKLGLRVMFNESQKVFSNIEYDVGKYEDYEILRINNTVPDCRKDMIKGTSFPLQFRMAQFHAIDFNKGCYIGQETVARMYRAGVKKNIYTIISEHQSFCDTKVMCAQQEIGRLLSNVGNIGLCLLDISSEHDFCNLKIGGAKVKILLN